MKRLLLCFAFLAASFAFSQESEKGEGPTKNIAAEEQQIPHELEWKWLNFVILAGGIGYLVSKYLNPHLQARAEEIRRGIQDAAVVKAEAEKRASEIEARIANLSGAIEEFRKSAQKEMEAEDGRLRAETAAEIQKIQARAEAEIASAAKLASQELRKYSAELALQLAEQRLRSRLTPQAQDGLARNFVQDLRGKAARN